jgi:integrase/recombinase XerD
MTSLQINDLTAKVEQSGNNPISTFLEPSILPIPYPTSPAEQIPKVVEVEQERGTPQKKEKNQATTLPTTIPLLPDNQAYLKRFQDKGYQTRYFIQTALHTLCQYLQHRHKSLQALTTEDTLPFLKHSFETLYQNLQSLAEGTYWKIIRVLKTYLQWIFLSTPLSRTHFLQIHERECNAHYQAFFQSKHTEHRSRYYSQEEILRAYEKYLHHHHQRHQDQHEKKLRLQKFLKYLISADKTLYTADKTCIQAWQEILLQKGEYSADYQAKHLRAVKLFFDWFCKQGYRKEHSFPQYNFYHYWKSIHSLTPSGRPLKSTFHRVPEQFRILFDTASLHEETLGLEEKTRYTHKKGWEFFLRYLEQRSLFRIEDVDEPLLEKYCSYLTQYRNEDEKPLPLNTRTRYLIALKKLFTYLSRYRHIPRDPTCVIDLPKNPRGLPTSGIKDRELQLLLESPSLEAPLGIRDRALLETLYSTGVRNKELRFVRIQDLDFEMGLLRIHTPKGGAQFQRVIAIGQTALFWIQRYLQETRSLLLKNKDSEYLFLNKEGERMSGSALLQIVKNALHQSHIKNPRIVTHSFRVACATGMLKGKGQNLQGADIKWVQEQLGHNNIQSTARYLRLVPGELKRIHTLHHPRENSRKNSRKKIAKMKKQNGSFFD